VRHSKSLFASVALTSMIMIAGSATAENSDAGIARNALIGGIRSMEKIPSGGFTAVEGDGVDGLAFISDTGRYVIRGEMYDTWTGRKVSSLADLREVAGKVSLSKLGISPDELGAFRFGRGPSEVTVFVDPNCPHCHGLMSAMPALADRYTFSILVVPVLGRDSETATRALSCAADKDAALRVLMAGPLRAEPPQKSDCDLVPIQKRLVTAQLIGVRGVPFVIAPDGRTKGGVPDDLGAWLAGSAR